MCNTFAVYFQIFATFGYKKVKNSDNIRYIDMYYYGHVVLENGFVNYKKSFNARKITKKVITKPIIKKNQKNHWA